MELTRPNVSSAYTVYLMPPQKYTIRDLNTGQLFVVDAEPSPAMEALAQGPPGSPTAGRGGASGGGSQQLVTDVSSGREMSLEEFDRTLGLHSALEVCTCGPPLLRGWCMRQAEPVNAPQCI